MKKALIFMMQPPGSSGVQANQFNKLLLFMENHGWELHFVGPDPAVASLYQEPVLRCNEICHYTRNIGPSQYFSVKRNRIKGHSPVKILYWLCQAASMVLEKLFRFDSDKYLEKGMIEQAVKAIGQHDYRLIAGYSPDFKILNTAYVFARRHNKPLLALMMDPYGARDGEHFYPAEPVKQKEILGFASGVFFCSPLTRDRYVKQGFVEPSKSFVLLDCFPDMTDHAVVNAGKFRQINIAYLGTLASWRPIDSLLDAFETFRTKPESPKLRLAFYGHVYPEATCRIKNTVILSEMIHVYKEPGYRQSHEVARHADALLVVIGPRHIDNCPSKFFEYLCHPKPVLVIGPKGNPIQEIVATLGIGVYSDITSPDDIVAGLVSIAENYDSFKAAYTKNKDLIQEYSAERTASRWAQVLTQGIKGTHNLIT